MKPTDCDVSFKYICGTCELSHWIFLREAQTNGFKVVCECGSVIEPDIIEKIDIIYKKETKSIDVSINKQCVCTLMSFGYSNKEASVLVKKSFDELKINDSHKLLECALKLGSN